jgi:hypothetical protein
MSIKLGVVLLYTAFTVLKCIHHILYLLKECLALQNVFSASIDTIIYFVLYSNNVIYNIHI